MKTFTIGMILSQLAVFAWAGTLRDNFDDGNFDGWRQRQAAGFDQTGQWSVVDGELVVSSQNVCAFLNSLEIGDDSWGDYEFQADVKVEQTFAAGCGNWIPGFCISMHQKPEVIAGIDVCVANRGAWNINVCEVLVPGNIQNLPILKNVTIKEEEWHTLRITGDKNGYQMFIDDKKVCETNNKLVNTGLATIGARNGVFHFDNVIITGDDIPDRNLGLSVQSQGKLTTTWGQIKVF